MEDPFFVYDVKEKYVLIKVSTSNSVEKNSSRNFLYYRLRRLLGFVPVPRLDTSPSTGRSSLNGVTVTRQTRHETKYRNVLPSVTTFSQTLDTVSSPRLISPLPYSLLLH